MKNIQVGGWQFLFADAKVFLSLVEKAQTIKPPIIVGMFEENIKLREVNR